MANLSLLKPLTQTSRTGRGLKPCGQGGFSLLEVLVAFAILALSLGVLLRIFSGDGRLAGQGEEHSRAVVLAESLLAGAGVETPLQPGETRGSIDGQFDWVMRITPFILPGTAPLPEQQLFKPYWVAVTVEWGEADDLRSFDLGSLRLVGNVNRPGACPPGFGQQGLAPR